MNEGAGRSTRTLTPSHLRKGLEEQASAPPINLPPNRRRSRAERFSARFMVLIQIFVFVSVIVIPAAAVARSTQSQTPAASEEPTPTESTETPSRGGKAVAPPTEEPSATPKPKPKPSTTRSTPKAAPKATTKSTKPSKSRGSTTKTPTVAPATETQTVTTAAVGEPTIVSDKADYAPGETVTLTGENWAPAEVVHIFVNDTLGSSWNRNVDVTASDAGQITDAFQLPGWFVSNYNVIATGPVSGTATTTFTDLSIGTYDQCSNDDGDGFGGDPGTCNWINGNLQGNNSTYPEGDATVQRLWLTDFTPGSTHTVTIQYGTTKQGKHAYDYLTSWDFSEDWITVADRCDTIDGCVGAAETTLGIPDDPNVPGAIEPGAGADRLFTMRGGTLNSATTPTIVSGTYAGDSETSITITFTVASSGTMCATQGQTTTCDVALWFGAHVARTDQWTAFNGTTGAGSVSGSPYHVSLDKVDGASIGSRDNQMQASAVVANGTIVIVKNADPDNAQNFEFSLTGQSNFFLDDDADPGLPSSQSFSVAPGPYTATEVNIPAGWTLTNLVCVDPTSNTTVNLGTATATINVASAETVTCTYTDTLGASLTVVKVTDPASDPQDFDFDLTGSGVPADLDLDTDAASAGTPSQQTFPLTAAQLGAHTVIESAVDGWSLTALGCTGDADSSTNLGTRTATLDIDAGETVVCTFTNTKQGSITIIKDVNPEPDATDFSFTTSANLGVTGNNFLLDDDLDATLSNTRLFGGLAAGATYTVTEDGETGYALTALSCSGLDANDSSSGVTGVVSVNLDPGQTVECTFTNSKLPTIIVRKITTGTAGGPFTFTTTGGNGFTTPFDLTTLTPGVAVERSFLIDAAGIGGDFTVTESALPLGFVFTDVGCATTTVGAGGTLVGTVPATRTGTIDNLAAGATVTCTFINSGALTTRTQGFWATHLSLVQAVWSQNSATVGGITTDGMTVEERTLCGELLGVPEVMGGFWSNIAKTSTGAKRSPLDQARMKLLQQLLAAILNNQLFGSVPSGNTSIEEAKDAFCTGSLLEVRTAHSAMAAFNESGDSGLFTPGASADPKAAKLIANITFWDVLP